MIRNYILATAGHVDHGKSSLVKALTGIDPDRLPEEKARGITIDLGFAHLELPNGPDIYSVGLVDVPGHEDFVKNMVAGVGSVNAALLVVAADDGWMPQTEEHLQILSYMGVSRGIVALTKIDLAQNENEILAAVRAKLKDTPLASAPIIPTSVTTGRGIDELKSELTSLLSETPPSADIEKPRLPIDRIFTLHGVGVVVTGTLSGGELRKGQSVLLQPSGKRARIRSIHTYNKQVETSQPGTRTALNVSDVGADEIRRGDVITEEKFASTSHTWDVALERSARAPGRGIKDGALVRVHFGSGNAPARIIFLDAKNLSGGERAIAQVRFDEPFFAFVGDRFIVRDSTERETLAGGVILSANAERRHFHSEQRRRFLQARAANPNDPSAFIATEKFARRETLLLESRFGKTEINTAIEQLQKQNRIVIAGDLIIEAGLWNRLRTRAANFIDDAHRQHPDQRGAALNDLRGTCDCAPEIFDALLSELCRADFVQSGATISRKSHRLELPPELRKAAEKVTAALNAKPLDPPSVKEIAPDNASQQALRFLIQTGEAIEVSKEIVLAKARYTRAVAQVRAFLTQRSAATASELRQALGTTRRVIIPLLEHMDKQGLTRRVGDARVLNRAA